MDETEESAPPEPRFLPFGDAALIVEFGETRERRLSAAVLALDAALAGGGGVEGLGETAPSFRSLLVEFDPLVTDAGRVEAAIRGRLAGLRLGAEASSRRWRLPVCHEGELGADLEAVAERAGMRPTEVIERHVGGEHHVYMIGFLPGCPYMGDLDPALDLPRRSDPRTKVPAGSVAIAVGLTVIYPFDSPGGWHILGRTPARLFDPAAGPPALLAPGDRVAFEPVGRAEFDRLDAAAAAGEWTPEPEEAA